MMDKGHCKLLHEGDAIVEYADFYDYSSSYPDNENDENEETKPNSESDVDLTRLDDTGYELTLPSGAKVGHRSLMRYYRYVALIQGLDYSLSWGSSGLNCSSFPEFHANDHICMYNYFNTFRQNLTNERALVPHKMTKIQSHYKTFGWIGLSKPEAKM